MNRLPSPPPWIVTNPELKTVPTKLKMQFLNLVDYLTALHLRVLLYFHDPPGWFRSHGLQLPSIIGAPVAGLEEGMPELRDRRDIYEPIIEDLYNRGMLNTDRVGMQALMSLGIFASRTTLMGKEFIRYISSL